MKKMESILGVLSLVFFISGTAGAGIQPTASWPEGKAFSAAADRSRNLLFVGCDTGVHILNTEDPDYLRPVAQIDTLDQAGHVYDLFYDDYLYIAGYNAGLLIYDVSDPYSPHIIGSYVDDGVLDHNITFAESVFVSGDYAYVCGTRGMHIIDVGDPFAPEWTGKGDLSGAAEDVFVSGNYAYVAHGTSELRIYNIQNPASPGSPVVFPGTASGASYTDVFVKNGVAYLIKSGGELITVNVSDPSAPASMDTRSLPGAASIHVSGSYAFVAGGINGLYILNISNPSAIGDPVIHDTAGSAFDALAVGADVYIADNTEGVSRINAADPLSPLDVNRYNTLINTENLFVSGSYAYIADQRTGLRIVDLGVPSMPVEIGYYRFPDGGTASGVHVSGDYAYVTDDSGDKLWIVDISIKQKPVKVKEVALNPDPYNVFVSGGYAYIANGADGLQIVNVTNPASAYKVGSGYATPGSAADVHVAGSYAYVADTGGGLQIVDVADPGDPRFFASGNAASSEAVHVSGNHVFVADGHPGIKIFNVGDPENPSAPGTPASYDPGYAHDVYVSGDYAFIAGGSSYGIIILDVRDPMNPIPVANGEYNTPGGAKGVFVYGDYPLVADGEEGLAVLKFLDKGVIEVSPKVIEIREGGEPATITFTTGAAPAADITIYLESTNPGELTLDKDRITITGANWDTGAQVQVSPENETIRDGAQKCAIITRPAVSNDTDYEGVDPENIFVNVVDEDTDILVESVYPSLGTVGQPLSVRITGQGFNQNSLIYIRNVNSGSYTQVTSGLTVNSASNISVSIPAQPSGHYNLKVTDGGSEADELADAFSFADSTEVTELNKNKAIIAAGGGRSLGTDMWRAILKASNKAYRALYYQGYPADNILYLSPEGTDAVGDGNNDVDAGATVSNLNDAISSWSVGASHLLIYLVGPGNSGVFELQQSEGATEFITAQELDSRLDALQNSQTIDITLIYDACKSGSFMQALTPPAGKQRIVVTSAASEQKAWFLDDGELSFSHRFWNLVADTGDLTTAFNGASGFMSSFQNALIDTNGDGSPDSFQKRSDTGFTIGRGRTAAGSPPSVGTASANPAVIAGENPSTLTASEVLSDNGISRVWARIIPPTQYMEAAEEPVLALPTRQLLPDGENRYAGDYDSFEYTGVYGVFIYAEDILDYQSLPASTNVTQESGTAFEYELIMDIDGKGAPDPDLADLILVLKALAGVDVSELINPYFPVHAFDVNGDLDIGIQEAVYIMQLIAGLR